MPVERLLGLELPGTDAALVHEQVREVDGLHVVAHIAPRRLRALANGADVAVAAALLDIRLQKNLNCHIPKIKKQRRLAENLLINIFTDNLQ